jgi:hypothetical protein
MDKQERRLRSTDKDLLVAQKVLGRIRRPDLAPKTLDDLVKQSRANLSRRFVQEKFDGELQTVLRKNAGPRQHRKAYNLTATFALKGIRVKGSNEKFIAQVTFKLDRVIGQGPSPSACLTDAKEKFRLHIGNSIRDSRSELRKLFLENTEVQVNDGTGNTDILAVVREKVLETFRLWLGNSIRDTNGDIKKRFYPAVKHEEVRITKVCTKCGERKVEMDFWTKKGEVDECADCRPAATSESEIDDDLDDEDEESDEDDEEDEE